MQQKKIEMRDVLRVIENGSISMEPDIHPKTNRFNYRIDGETVDKAKLTVCVDIYDVENKIIIITVI